jgi:ribA/ribD-fused uncharacterized protein
MNKIYFQSRSFPSYRFLSNFYEAVIKDKDGIEYLSTEHYYHCQKAVDENDFIKVMVSSTPKAAKENGKTIAIRKDWDSVKDNIMLTALRLKFTQHQDLKIKLLATGDDELIEWAPWGDTYWGVNKKYEGQNKLGKMLMQVREELK